MDERGLLLVKTAGAKMRNTITLVVCAALAVFALSQQGNEDTLSQVKYSTNDY